MLLEKITNDLKQATFQQDSLVLKTLRFILSLIHYQEIEKQRKLTDEEIILLLQREVKKREEALNLIKKGNRPELVEEEVKKLAVINKYLPKQLNDEEIIQVIEKVRQELPQANTGQLIGAVVKRLKGQAQGERIASLVKKQLGSHPS